ncbi:MAG: hypothetical protein AAF367_02510 [Pseudomonadota bacterium]
MIARFVFYVLASCLCVAGSALAEGGQHICDADDPTLIWSDCGAVAHGELLLLPEDASLTPDGALDVTGVYTATDKRGEDKPKPVGLFVRDGTVISREYVRFDGVLVVEPEGEITIGFRRNYTFRGNAYDLEEPTLRARFIDDVAEAGASLAQSHLLIIDGRVDAAPVEGAPRFRRRILMQAVDGTLGIYDSSPRALTLAEAAEEVAQKFAPAMALNLDMGSYDFCRDGTRLCGALTYEQTGKLSNMLRLTR